jgi:hypothetical protein
MDQQEGMSNNKAPLFNGGGYALWKIRMKSFMLALGFDIWKSVVDGYTAPTTPPTDVAGKKICNDNSREVNAILGGLTNSICVKVMHCKSAKEIWDKLEVVYEGDSKVREAKLQTYRTQFENLKMKEEENIVEYFHRVDEVVNSIREVGEELTDKPIVKNILRSLPMRYDAKISTIEDRPELDTLTVDQLHGIFTAYEMRTGNDKPSKDETTFKASKEKKKQEHMSHEDQSDISYVEEANFIKKLQKGFGKYKGKLPFKCFNCGRIGHFANKCPYPKKEENDEEVHNQKNQYKKKFYKKKKNFYSKEDISSSDMSEDEDSELLFMGMNTQNNDVDDEENSEFEGEVNLEEELISALEELRKYKKKNKLLRAQLQEFEESHQSKEIDALRTIKESEKIISDLKSQLLEANKIEKVILKQLSDKKQVCEKLEAEIKLLKSELEKEKKGSKFENSSKILDEILSSQRSPNNKTGLGYTQDSTSTSQGSVKRPISYADALKGSLRREDNKEKMIPLKIVPHKQKSTLPY